MKIVPVINNNKTQLLPFVVTLVLLIAQSDIHAAQTTRVSVTSTGGQGNGDSYWADVSADGRYVVFSSVATNLVAGDTNMYRDVFLRERLTGVTTRVSLTSAGAQANGDSSEGLITPDGRYVVFVSSANNLVSGDTNGAMDVFVRDRVANTTTRVNLTSAGAQANGDSYAGTITPDGRYVVFDSDATNLVSGDTNGKTDVFIRDRSTNTTTRLSVGSTGGQGNGDASPGYLLSWAGNKPSVSPDGRYVAFYSDASNLVSGDTNGTTDVFVRDRTANTTTRVSVSSTGGQGNSRSLGPWISADGRYVAFTSDSSNLVIGDTNGYQDVFVRDRVANTTTRVSVSSTGSQINDLWLEGEGISADGRYVTFMTWDDSITLGVYVRDRQENRTTLVSANSGDGIYGGNVSADGRYVGFYTRHSEVAGDTNNNVDVFLRDRLVNTSLTADLQASMTVKPASIVKGQNGSYKVTIKNNSAITAQYVWLTDVISNGTLVGITPSAGTCSKAAISVCRIPSLGPGASATITLSIKANANPLSQLIFLNAEPKDNVSSNNTLKVSTPIN